MCVCELCGKEFSSRDKRPGRGRFCSAGCRDSSNRKPTLHRVSPKEISDRYSRHGVVPHHHFMLKSDKGFTLAHPLVMLYLSRTNTNVKRWRSLLISRKCVARGNGVQDTLREFVVAGLISTGMNADYLSGFVDATEMRGIASAVENYILGYDDGKAIMKALVFH